MNGKGSSARPSLTVSNLFGLVTGMAEDLQSLVGATVVRRRVYARFLDAVNFVAGGRGYRAAEVKRIKKIPQSCGDRQRLTLRSYFCFWCSGKKTLTQRNY
ncbi:minor tail protein [Escherichia coli]|nr:minor tail protein [Escherichia coli]